MTKKEYEAKCKSAKDNNTADQYGYYVDMMDVNFDYIAYLEAQNATLTADNATLIQQVNECGAKHEKLITWLSDYFASHDFCMKQDMGCIDSFVSCEECWRKWLEGGQDA